MIFLTGWMQVSDLPLRMPITLSHSFVVSELGCQCLYKQLSSHPGAWSVPSLTSWLPAGPAFDCQPEMSQCPGQPGTSGSGTCWAESSRHTWAPALLQKVSWHPIKQTSDNGEEGKDGACCVTKVSISRQFLCLTLLSQQQKVDDSISLFFSLIYQEI